MNNVTRLLLVGTALSLGSTLPEASQETEPTEPGALLQEVSELNRSMKEIASLLRETLEHQQMNMLMKRLELKTRSLAPMEEELRRARSDHEGVSNNLKELQMHMQFVEEKIEEEELTAVDPSESTWQMQQRQVDLQIEVLQERLKGVEEKMYEMENDLISRRNEILDWEDYLDEHLGLP